MARRAVGVMLVLLAAGAAPLAAQRRPAWSFVVENDVFAFWRPTTERSDRDYSSGVQLGMALPVGSDARSERTLLLALNHQIFTPDITEPRGVPADRPYAALLTATATLRRDRPADRQALSLGLSITGPPALGKELQTLVHRVVGSPEPVGWEDQLPFELGLTVAYAGDRGLAALGDESGPRLRSAVHWGGELGTVRTAVSFGLGAVVGWRPPPVWQPLPPTGAERSGLRVFFPLGVGLDLVAQSIVLDGGVIARASGIDREALVPHAEFGIGVELGAVALSWTGHLTGPEFEAQPGWHQYGTFRMSLR